MKNTKKLTSALILGSALLFNACSSDMFDTEEKNTAYYLKKENQAETKKKAEWCLSFYGPGFKSVKDFLSDEAVSYFTPVIPLKMEDGYDVSYGKISAYGKKFVNTLLENEKKYDPLINLDNCRMAIYSQILIEDVKNLESEK